MKFHLRLSMSDKRDECQQVSAQSSEVSLFTFPASISEKNIKGSKKLAHKWHYRQYTQNILKLLPWGKRIESKELSLRRNWILHELSTMQETDSARISLTAVDWYSIHAFSSLLDGWRKQHSQDTGAFKQSPHYHLIRPDNFLPFSIGSTSALTVFVANFLRTALHYYFLKIARRYSNTEITLCCCIGCGCLQYGGGGYGRWRRWWRIYYSFLIRDIIGLLWNCSDNSFQPLVPSFALLCTARRYDHSGSDHLWCHESAHLVIMEEIKLQDIHFAFEKLAM